MAQLKGTVTGSLGSYVNYYLDYTLNSQNQDNLTSNITLHAYAQATTTSAAAYNLYGTAPSKIGYKESGSGSYTYVVDRVQDMDFRDMAMVDLGSWTGDVQHSSDGTLVLDLYGTFDTNGPSSVQVGTVSGTWTLPTIETGSIKVKNNGSWRNGVPYVKVNGSWRKGTAYVKVNGSWKKGVL